ncbi:sodium:proton antiporter [bacterium]|nr:sodium:proton antiporter [bacterium]
MERSPLPRGRATATGRRHRCAPAIIAALLTLALAAAALGSGGAEHPGEHPGEAPTAHGAAGHAGHAGQAAEGGEGHGHVDPVGLLPLWSALPFVCILLSIALFPLLAPHFWHHHFPKVSAAWALLFAIPFLFWDATAATGAIIHIVLVDYVPFIILLWGLYTIAGGIYIGGSLQGKPVVNATLLLIGTFLASLIGTTGAAMVLIRPLLRANAWRRSQVHVVIFFIFLIANVGGSLTPLGDPPLFLGFLHGVPFFWVTKALLPHMLTATALVLGVFLAIDTLFYRRETATPPAAGDKGGIRIEGLHNLLFLLGVMAAVVMSGSLKLPEVTVFRGGAHPVVVPLQNWLKDLIIIAMGVLSLRTTARVLREKNGFSWAPIQEVAYLFAGIFITIIPALAILKAGSEGALAGLVGAVHGPVRFFWATGALSSFLDNAPTYLTFFNAALGDLGATEAMVPGMLGSASKLATLNPEFVHDLQAISAGAVFMGAMTYIGNAPNFMVKSIAEEAGIPMPSFFGYLFKWSIPVLLPVFVVITFVFFAR